MTLSQEQLCECLRQLKPSEGEAEEEKPSWKAKPLYGIYHRQIKVVADIKWLEKTDLKDCTWGTNHGSTRTRPEHKSNTGQRQWHGKARQGKFICIAQFNSKVIQSALQRH